MTTSNCKTSSRRRRHTVCLGSLAALSLAATAAITSSTNIITPACAFSARNTRRAPSSKRSTSSSSSSSSSFCSSRRVFCFTLAGGAHTMFGSFRHAQAKELRDESNSASSSTALNFRYQFSNDDDEECCTTEVNKWRDDSRRMMFVHQDAEHLLSEEYFSAAPYSASLPLPLQEVDDDDHEKVYSEFSMSVHSEKGSRSSSSSSSGKDDDRLAAAATAFIPVAVQFGLTAVNGLN